MRSGPIRSETRLLLALFLFAFLLRFAFIFVQTHYQPFNLRFYGGDSGLYDTIAQSLVAGTGYAQQGMPTANEPPGYPLFLAGTYSLFGRTLFVVQIIQALLGAASVLLLFRIARSLFNARVALVAAGAFAVYPHHLFWTGYILTDTLYVFLTLAFLTFCVQYQQQRSVLSLISAAILFGFTILTRATLLPLTMLIPIWLYLIHRDTRSPGARRTQWLSRSALFLLLFSLTLSPWIIRNAVQFHAFIPTDTKSAVALSEAFGPRATGGTGGDSTEGIDYFDLTFSPGTPAAEQQRAYLVLAWQGIRERPLWLLTSIPHKLWNMWRPNYAGASLRNHLLFDPLYLFAVLFGAIGMWRSRTSVRRYALLYLYVLFSVVLHGLLYGIIRYRLPIEPVLLLFAADELCTLSRGWAKGGLLESLLQQRRMANVLPYIPSGTTVADLGCGAEAVFLRAALPKLQRGIGIDLTPPAKSQSAKLHFIRLRIQKKLPLPTASCTRVVSLAAFGCFGDGPAVLRECRRILKPSGLLVFTVPMPLNHYVMEIFKRVRLLDPDKVDPYKHFYSTRRLRRMLAHAGFVGIHLKKFQLGLNCLIVARRPA